jgi:hypothetical protein
MSTLDVHQGWAGAVRLTSASWWSAATQPACSKDLYSGSGIVTWAWQRYSGHQDA